MLILEISDMEINCFALNLRVNEQQRASEIAMREEIAIRFGSEFWSGGEDGSEEPGEIIVPVFCVNREAVERFARAFYNDRWHRIDNRGGLSSPQLDAY
jgi:hypothetical protein